MTGKYIVFSPSGSSARNDSAQHFRSVGNYSLGVNRTQGHEDPTVVLLRYFIEVWLCVPINLLGILGNLLSLVVLCYMRKSKLRPVTTLLQALAVSDTLVLLIGFILRSLRYLAGDWYVPAYTLMYPSLFATAYVLRMINTWLTVLLTFDRYVAVCHPLHAQRLCTMRKTWIQITCVVVFAFAFSIPRYFESEIVYIQYKAPNQTSHHKPHVLWQYKTTWLMDDRLYGVIYRIVLFLLFQYLVPMAILVSLNGRVVCCLRRSDSYPIVINLRRRQRAPSSSSSSFQLMPHESSVAMTTTTTLHHHAAARTLTTVVVVIVLMCTICHTVAMTAQVLWSLQAAFFSANVAPRLDLARRYISNVTNLLLTFNSAVNFIIYCALSRNFRAVLDRCLLGWCCRHRLDHIRRRRHRSTMTTSERGTTSGTGRKKKDKKMRSLSNRVSTSLLSVAHRKRFERVQK